MLNLNPLSFSHFFKMLFVRLSVVFTIVAFFIFLPIFSNTLATKKTTNNIVEKNDKIEDLIPLLSSPSATESSAQSTIEDLTVKKTETKPIEAINDNIPDTSSQAESSVSIFTPQSKRIIVKKLQQVTTQKNQNIEVPIYQSEAVPIKVDPKPVQEVNTEPKTLENLTIPLAVIKPTPVPPTIPQTLPTPAPAPVPSPVPAPTAPITPIVEEKVLNTSLIKVK